MKLLLVALAVSSYASAGSLPVGAAETEKALQLRPKAAMTSAVAAVGAHSNAPFVTPSGEPELVLMPREYNAQEATRSSCNGERALCYDSASGRVVYKPARQFMPDIPGLRPENISIKRNQLVLRYSF